MSARYRTGVRYSPKAAWLQDWVSVPITSLAPVTDWHATREQTAQVAAQLESLGYDVAVVTR